MGGVRSSRPLPLFPLSLCPTWSAFLINWRGKVLRLEKLDGGSHIVQALCRRREGHMRYILTFGFFFSRSCCLRPGLGRCGCCFRFSASNFQFDSRHRPVLFVVRCERCLNCSPARVSAPPPPFLPLPLTLLPCTKCCSASRYCSSSLYLRTFLLAVFSTLNVEPDESVSLGKGLSLSSRTNRSSSLDTGTATGVAEEAELSVAAEEGVGTELDEEVDAEGGDAIEADSP